MQLQTDASRKKNSAVSDIFFNFEKIHLMVQYLSPVRGSRTCALAEKTMKDTLILGLKKKIKNEETV